MNMLNNMVSASSPLILIVCQLFVLRHTRSDPLHGLSTVTSYHLHFTDFLHVTLNDLCVCVCVCVTELYLGAVCGVLGLVSGVIAGWRPLSDPSARLSCRQHWFLGGNLKSRVTPRLRAWVGREVKVNSHPKNRFRLSLGTPHIHMQTGLPDHNSRKICYTFYALDSNR